MMDFKLFFGILFILILLPLCYASDFDSDGMDDYWERKNGLRVDKKDSDNDPDYDGLTNKEEYDHGTDPYTADSDGDGIDDKEEINSGTDPLDESDPGNFDASLFMNISIAFLMGVMIFLLIFYLVNLDYSKILSIFRSGKQPSKNKVKSFTPKKPISRPTSKTRIARMPINRISKPRTADQKSKIRAQIFDRFENRALQKGNKQNQERNQERKVQTTQKREKKDKNKEDLATEEKGNVIDKLAKITQDQGRSAMDRLKELVNK